MAKFCTKCGKPLNDGEICSCAAQGAPAPQRPVPPPAGTPNPSYPSGARPPMSIPNGARPARPNPNPNPTPNGAVPNGGAPGRARPPMPNPNQNPGTPPKKAITQTQNANGQDSVNINLNQISSTASSLWAAFKNQVGIGDPLINQGDTYERGKKIVPDCVKPNDSEIPVRQYQIATLKNRICGIPYMKAFGRIQVTNKRVIFRAPGNSLAGRTTLQHEFSIDEIAGIESRREFVFNFWDLIIGLLGLFIGGGLAALITFSLIEATDGILLSSILAFLFEAGSLAAFFMLKKRWWIKLLALGAGIAPMAAFGAINYMQGNEFIGALMVILAVPLLFFILLSLFIFTIRPNLALIIKTKSATEAIDIRRKKESIFALLGFGNQNDKDDHTGYREILPEKDAEISIREIGAMINDIQKLGDYGIEKWRK